MKSIKRKHENYSEWRNERFALHREDGPATENYNYNNYHWYFDGCIHREDGPALNYGDGKKYWYLRGVQIGSSMEGFTNEKFLKLMSPKMRLLWNGDVEELKRIAKLL